MNPKNCLIAPILLCLFITVPRALKSQKLELGIIQGSGISSYRSSSNGLDYYGAFPGYTGGLMLQYNFSKRFGLLTNVLYERNILSYDLTMTDASGNLTGVSKAKTRSNYISLPLMAGWRFGETVKFQLNTGLYLSYVFNRSFKFINQGTGKYAVSNIYIPDEARIDGGLVVGASMVLPLSNRANFSFELRNCIGLKGFGGLTTTYRNYQSLLLGLSFKIGKG